MKKDIKVGDIIRVIDKWFDMEGIIGQITKIYKHDPENPIEDHGTIEFEILDPKASKYAKKGELEHFTHYNWEKYLEILNDKKALK